MGVSFRTIFLLIVGSFFLFSCTPKPTFTREPGSDGETLVIGRVLFDCQLTKTGSIPIGKYRYNVELEFEDARSGQVLIIKTVDPQGFFYFHNPGFDQLNLVGFHYEQYYAQPDIHKSHSTKEFLKETNKKASAGMTLHRKKLYQIRQNKVNNLGMLVWEGDMRSRHHNITYNQEYKETRDAFAKRYPESQWNRHEWLDVRAEDY